MHFESKVSFALIESIALALGQKGLRQCCSLLAITNIT